MPQRERNGFPVIPMAGRSDMNYFKLRQSTKVDRFKGLICGFPCRLYEVDIS